MFLFSSLMLAASNTGGMVFMYICLGCIALPFIWQIGKSIWNKTFKVSNIFFENAREKMEMIALASTAGEVLALIMLALQRGMEFTGAIMRFSLIGLMELICTFISTKTSISLITWNLNTLFDKKTKKLNYGAYAISLVATIVLTILSMIAFCFPTYLIYQLYLESIGLLTFEARHAFLPWNSISTVPLDYENFEYARPELGALIMIWFNPIINITVFFLMYIEMFPKFKKEFYDAKASTTTAAANPGTKTAPITPPGQNLTDMRSVLDAVQVILGSPHSASDMEDRMCARLGRAYRNSTDYSTVAGAGRSKQINKHGDIINGSKSPEAIEQEMMVMLKGKEDLTNPKGVLGYQSVMNAQETKKHDIATCAAKLSDLSTKKTTATGTDLDTVNRDIGTYTTQKAALDKELLTLQTQVGTIKQDLTTLTRTLQLIP